MCVFSNTVKDDLNLLVSHRKCPVNAQSGTVKITKASINFAHVRAFVECKFHDETTTDVTLRLNNTSEIERTEPK